MAAHLVGLLVDRAASAAGGLVFLSQGELRLSWPELDRRARAIAGALRERGVTPGARVAILAPPGAEFVAGWFGCLYAGGVAVPLYPPQSGRSGERVRHVLRDAGAAHAVGTARQDDAVLRAALGDQVELVVVEQALTARPVAPVEVDAAAPAFLQYTSGSTAEPKGVIVTHRAVMANLAQIAEAFGHDATTIGVNWLPPYHDMGLVGTLLQPLYLDIPSYLMSPLGFVQRPARWLQAISRVRATTAGAPNFAFEFCVDRIRDAELAGIDLSSLRVMFCGAEPIRRATLERFVERFAPHGLDPRAILACYGLAEATLMVTAVAPGAGLTSRPIGPAGRERVSCGRPARGTEVAIVDPVSRVAVAAGDEGEIWVRGPSVAAGYWGRAGATHETFAAERVGGGEGWLRTGDLGAIVDGELYPTGRLKTVLIHDGRKIAAEDLEAAAVAAGSVAAIAFEGAEGGIALAIELAPGASSDWAELGAAIRARIAEEPGAPIRTLHAVERGRLFRTASGKLERAASGRALEAGTLEALARWDAERGWSPR